MSDATDETADAGEPDLKKLHKRYLAEIERYEGDAEKWEKRGKKVTRLYKDADNTEGKKKRYNILWSNVETLRPALYARDPKPEIERRFKDADPVGRAASEVLERCVTYTISCHGFTDVMRSCVQDRLLPGRGTAWVRYVPTLGEKETDPKVQPTEVKPAEPTEGAQPNLSLLYEQAIPDYVYWEDFGHSYGRVWEEVQVVWRKAYMTRKELTEEFGEIGQSIPLDYSPRGLKDEKVEDDLKKAVIYELWDKADGAVGFLSKTWPELVKYVSDPLHLTGAFPCPKPLFATLTNDSLIPVPDYALYQTQAQELEELTSRIGLLTKALRVVGVYDSSAEALGTLLSDTNDNKLVAVNRWAVFAERGGLKASIDFLPIKEVADTLMALYEARDKVKADLYEITGLSDIIRGNSDPDETATAQQMKGRFAVLRISDSQTEVQRFARDLIRLLAEIIAEHFSLDTIKEISGVKLLMQTEKEGMLAQAQQGAQLPPEQQELLGEPTWEEVYGLLHNDVLRNFRIDVETDSTIRTDEEAERNERIEFLKAAGTFLNQATQAGAQTPALVPLFSELLMFGVRSFRSARTIEPAFEAAQKQVEAQAKQPKPDPEAQKLQAQQQIEQAKLQGSMQIEQHKAQLGAQLEQSKQQSQSQQVAQQQQIEAQRSQVEMQQQMQLEQYKVDLQSQTDMQKLQLEHAHQIQIEGIKANSAERIARINADAKMQQTQLQAISANSIADKNADAKAEQAASTAE